MRSPLRAVLLGLIRFYRTWISPALPDSCRYTPSCSAYGLEAVTRFGALRGGYLTVRRILRCHPWRRGGTDPVPSSFSLRYPARTDHPDPHDPPMSASLMTRV